MCFVGKKGTAELAGALLSSDLAEVLQGTARESTRHQPAMAVMWSAGVQKGFTLVKWLKIELGFNDLMIMVES